MMKSFHLFLIKLFRFVILSIPNLFNPNPVWGVINSHLNYTNNFLTALILQSGPYLFITSLPYSGIALVPFSGVQILQDEI